MYSNKNFIPEPAPSSDSVSNAVRILGQFILHVYQVLYKRDLTSPPGESGYPFRMSLCDDNGGLRAFLTVRYNERNYDGSLRFPDLKFAVHADWFDDPDKAREADAKIVRWCEMLRQCARENKGKPHSTACCPLAEVRACVCAYSWQCELHGTRCVGTHD